MLQTSETHISIWGVKPEPFSFKITHFSFLLLSLFVYKDLKYVCVIFNKSSYCFQTSFQPGSEFFQLKQIL